MAKQRTVTVQGRDVPVRRTDDGTGYVTLDDPSGGQVSILLDEIRQFQKKTPELWLPDSVEEAMKEFPNLVAMSPAEGRKALRALIHLAELAEEDESL